MIVERLKPIISSLKASNHPYLNGAWTPLMEEVNVPEQDVIDSAVPVDIDGVYLRKTENQFTSPWAVFIPSTATRCGRGVAGWRSGKGALRAGGLHERRASADPRPKIQADR